MNSTEVIPKHIQTRLHKDGKRGNCFPTVISCLLRLDSPEKAIQIQEHYPPDGEDGDDWMAVLHDWLEERGYIWQGLDGHLSDDSYYLVDGLTHRSNGKPLYHVCIYKNGELYHDPHPDQSGLLTEEYFHVIDKV